MHYRRLSTNVSYLVKHYLLSDTLLQGLFPRMRLSQDSVQNKKHESNADIKIFCRLNLFLKMLIMSNEFTCEDEFVRSVDAFLIGEILG